MGFVPVVGVFADIINAIWYLAEGNYAYAAMSAIAAIPFLGDGFGLFAEGTKYACMFKKVMFGFGALGNIVRMGGSLEGISEISGDLTQKHLIDGKAWDEESTSELQEGLLLVGQTLVSAIGLGKSLEGFAGTQCFVAGTLVLTDEGNKPIEEIKAGDLVYSTNPETGESGYKEVARVFRRESNVLIHVFVNGEEIETTPDHPFWVESQWVLAKDLREGDVLTLADGTTAVVSKTYAELLDEPVIVYNFEVKDFHTYYVTDTGVLVHNATNYVGEGAVNSPQQIANQIPDQYKQNLMCEEFANEMENGMRISSIKGEKVIVQSQFTDFIWSDSYGVISENGKHYAVLIDNTIFDNLNPLGIDYGAWLSDLGIKDFPSLFDVTKIPIP